MERYYTELATAFVRGRLRDRLATIDDGLRAGLRLHKFKQDAPLGRVERVLGMLRGLQPESLLDVGSGRGTFLWPLLAGFPELPVTAIDVSEQRASDLEAVRSGGVARLTVARMDAQRMGFVDQAFDLVSMLEVLEHIPNPAMAMANALRVARRFVIASVPSVADDNPEHIHLFTPEQLRELAGGARVTIEHVLNHRIALVRVPS